MHNMYYCNALYKVCSVVESGEWRVESGAWRGESEGRVESDECRVRVESVEW